MSYSVKGTTITLTRGDTFRATVGISMADGSAYTPEPSDKIRFAVKKSYTDPEPLLNIDIPIDTMVLSIGPSQTKNFDFGKYVYDIQLTKANGDVDTFITTAKFIITEEVC